MKRIEKYRWRVRWGGKWIKTRHHATEEEARAMDPEAQRIEGSLLVVDVPDTDEERTRYTSYISVGAAGGDGTR